MQYSEIFSITDPLYELTTLRNEFGKDLYDEIFGGEDKFYEIYHRLVNTYELNRLNFLKQAGLLFLIFPSATHTRFSHSLGTFTLGTYALENIMVKSKNNYIKLEGHLRPIKVREEFLISLLIHDIGHLPFSHLLEESDIIKEKYINHENITLLFLTKESELYKSLKKHADKNNSETILDVIDCYKNNINIEKVKQLLDENNEDPISELICGYLDLDRLDHYYRDSFFTGLKLASISIKGFLDSIIIDIDSEKPKVVLRPEGLPHVLQLLFGREMLWQRAFDSDINRAYQSMFVKAVDSLLKNNKELIDKLPFMNEDELIVNLYSSNKSKDLTERIFSRKPYYLLYKKQTTMNEKELINAFNNFLKKYANNDFDFLLFIPRGFGKTLNMLKEWLLKDIPVIGGSSIHNTHGELIHYFDEQIRKRNSTIRIFSSSDFKISENEIKSFFEY